ncbi:hypothetical protein [Enterococcus sp. BWR-S5]|uniref:hypothetical protein n=1 Tax=Enterococcus sp. BWR-S5 TaxID=2787714 RepID=UPI001922526F|nr:hypothetical protein [Enterococcus sp. BWR-S5]MBL1224580.1 hypothetical protein [Enterococcus sp. BWR-S5]MBL1224591.1 hypothetical protein [Enterococcus sp. BWR-S5]
MFSSQADILRALLVEAKLLVTKHNELYYVLSTLSNNFSSYSKAFTSFSDFMQGATSTGMFYWVRKTSQDLSTYATSFGSYSSFMQGTTSTGMFYWVRKTSQDLSSYATSFTNFSNFMQGTTSTGMFYWIKQMGQDLSSLSSSFKLYSNFMQGTASTGMFYWIKQIGQDLSALLSAFKLYSNFVQGTTSTGLFYWIKQIATNTGNITGGNSSDIIKKLDEIIKALRSIDFGDIFQNITNEAGTNIWDVLGKLVDGIFDLSGEVIKATAEIIETLSNLLLELSKLLISLIVPENLDFLDDGFSDISDKFTGKFSFILDLSGQIKSAFTPTETDFLNAVSFEFMGVSFDANEGKPALDKYVPKFRAVISLFIWFIVAIYLYRKLTGQGDLINDN